MGEMSPAVFVLELLSQLRSRQINLDQMAQHKAASSGQQLDKKDAIKHIVEILAQTIQSWTPRVNTDNQAQNQVAELQAKIAELEARQQSPESNQSMPNDPPEPKQPPANSPIGQALQGQPQRSTSIASQLLVTPGSTIPWLESDQPETYTTAADNRWFKNLELDASTKQATTKQITAVEKWWQEQPDDAETTIHRVAVVSGIPVSKIKSNHTDQILKVLTVAICMASCSRLLKNTRGICHKSLPPSLFATI